MTFKRSFIIVVFLIIHFRGLAQETIIPSLSADYINKLIDTAKKNYPRVRSYQSRINIANSNISKTRMSIFNALTVSYVYQPGTTTIDPVNPSTSYFKGLQAGVFLNLGTLLSQPYLTRQAKEELLIAHNDQDEYQITIATEVKKRYYLYIQRIAELKLQTKSAQDVESSLKDITYKFQKGEETFDNYNKIQVQYTDHQQTKIQAEANVFIAKADLEELLGTKLENIK
ncbi:TolC family protein [Mucilaginibacter sp. UR6-11]|uniref:TolC family protein n=1 Tax=Mucilaginibacter sp. UR6-11 TaxID=1435644 RepID=UPI001E5E0E86|nr:TolC family protein [Mucilaginibacter sp. UR6-11]MCC8423774.1 TolC family protein [Mucilaginibacter sp. UR6-11]